MGAVQRHGRDHHIQTRTVGQTPVDVRIGFVHPPADGGDDALDHIHQMIGVAEARVDRLKLALALHINGARAIDDHIVHAWIVQERLKRTEARDLVDHVQNEKRAFGRIEREPARPQHNGDGTGDIVQQRGALDIVTGDAFAVQIFQRRLEHPEFDVLIIVGDLDVFSATGLGHGVGHQHCHPALARLSQWSSRTVVFTGPRSVRRPRSSRNPRKLSP